MPTAFQGRRVIVLVVAALGLLGGCARASDGDGVTPTPSPTTLDEAVLRSTAEGRAVNDYLGCTDFDCTGKLKSVVELNGAAVPLLLRLLGRGFPELPTGERGAAMTKMITALGEIRDPAAVGPLKKVLQDADPVVRANSAKALGELGDGRVLDDLLHLLKDLDPFVRESVAKALAALGRREALPALRTAADKEPETYVRRAMEHAIQKLSAG